MNECANAFLTSRRDEILRDWFALLRFASVGTDPARLGECAKCAAWLKRWLKGAGFEVEVVAPGGATPPVVFAERAGEPGAPTALLYGHYDVQPEDPVEAWTSPPFEPELRDNRVYARGAQDNKGQFFAFLQGWRAAVGDGGKMPALRVMLEGQEECGSPVALARMDEWRERLKADVLMVPDTGMHASGRPAIVAGLRGIMTLSVRARGASRDLHSGTHGG
ncbi:MAG: M20/M25/M40 family metallo-hydrolase, partial [Kiritimatiellaeota bacterium]|nr:M20/M25/M40 family metallo-hydrolase [Kiritimatiellota bacterium]